MMGKLLPCPYCGNEFPTITGTQSKGVLIRCPQCNTTFSRDFYETGRGELGKQRTIEAWNRRAQSANEPLTLEELREMHGQPVCCIYPGCSTGGEWFLINSQGAYKNGSFLNFRYYGEWLAYRAKPEPPEGEAND